jgi:hypothetical protein
MRQILFVLAVLGAIVSGWVPAIAATLDAAGPFHGMHATAIAAAGDVHAAHERDHGQQHEKTKPAAHPVACSACFAIEAARLEPLNRRLDISSPVSAATPQLAGLAPSPLDPPPRS